MRRALALGAVASLALAHPSAQEPAPEKPGLPVGSLAPDFTLRDQHGSEVSLASLREKGPVALVFYRSAEWCLYCKLQLVQLQQNLAEIEAAGGRIAGISADPLDALRGFTERSSITFPLLSDSGSETISAFEFLSHNPATPGVAYHGTFVVDAQGIIRSKLYQVSYRERPALDALLQALRAAREPLGASAESPLAEVPAGGSAASSCCRGPGALAPPARIVLARPSPLDRSCRPQRCSRPWNPDASVRSP